MPLPADAPAKGANEAESIRIFLLEMHAAEQ
jgi:hypothetical protein